MLQQLKSLLRDQLGLAPWMLLVLGGSISYLALNALLRRPLTSAWGLLAPLALGVALESYEIWVQYNQVGLFAPGNDPILAILGRHGLDVLLVLAVPLLVVTLGAATSR